MATDAPLAEATATWRRAASDDATLTPPISGNEAARLTFAGTLAAAWLAGRSDDRDAMVKMQRGDDTATSGASHRRPKPRCDDNCEFRFEGSTLILLRYGMAQRHCSRACVSHVACSNLLGLRLEFDFIDFSIGSAAADLGANTDRVAEFGMADTLAYSRLANRQAGNSL